MRGKEMAMAKAIDLEKEMVSPGFAVSADKISRACVCAACAAMAVRQIQPARMVPMRRTRIRCHIRRNV